MAQMTEEERARRKQYLDGLGLSSGFRRLIEQREKDGDIVPVEEVLKVELESLIELTSAKLSSRMFEMMAEEEERRQEMIMAERVSRSRLWRFWYWLKSWF